ncbi:MAG: ABC transporter substrate-binding protein [Alphaproteobacteria bacterium]
MAQLIGRSLAAALAVAAALPGAALAQADGRTSDKLLVIARDMDMNSLDPPRSFCDTCQLYIGATYERLINLSPDNRAFVPELAERWSVSADGKTYTFNLDPKAVFSDGSPVESKDVRWSWERLRNMKGGPSLRMRGVAAIETPDAKTVVIRLEAPDSDFLAKAADAYTVITNSDVIKAQGGTDAADANTADKAEGWMLRNSAGSGPYVLESYTPQNEIRMKRNPNYWRTKPYFAGVVLKQSKDAVSQAQMLQNGSADIAMQVDMETAKKVGGGNIEITRGPSLSQIYMAISPGAKNLAVPLTPKIREAIAYAINYQNIIDFAAGGAGRLQPSPLHGDFIAGRELPPPVYDPNKAKALLAEAGVPKGFKLEAVYPNLNAFGIELTLVAQLVQRDLAKVGIELSLQPVTFPVFRDRITNDGIPLTVSYSTPGYFGPGNTVQFFAMIPGSVWATRAHAEREPSILNARISELFKQALADPTDGRYATYQEIALEMIKDKITVPLINVDNLIVHRKGLQGMRYTVCCLLPVGEINEKP